jgi:endonuclease/exonuclease/phosphatase family metal-dependent hydrolase
VKNNVQANPVEFSSKFQESVWISVKLEGGDELLAGCIDRSNSGTDENNECLLKLLNEVNDAKYSHVLIMGDFNFEKINWNTWSTSSPETHIDFKFI